MVGIIPKRVNLVSFEIEFFEAWVRAGICLLFTSLLGRRRPLLFFCGLAAISGGSLPWQLLRLVPGAHLAGVAAKLAAKLFRLGSQRFYCVGCVHAKFGISVPRGHVEGKVK